MNELTFDFEDMKYKLTKPNAGQASKANRIKAKEFSVALKDPESFLRDKLSDVLMEKGHWDKDKERKYVETAEKMISLTEKLTEGQMKLAEGKDLALEISILRKELIIMLSKRGEFDSLSCEGRAEQAYFNSILSQVLVYEDTGELVYKTYEEFLSSQDTALAYKAGSELYKLLSDDEDPDASLVENKFLKRFGFIDDQYRLVDKEGKLVDADGKYIDEEGYYVEWLEDGTSVRVDKDGEKIVEKSIDEAVFLDDDGNPIE